MKAFRGLLHIHSSFSSDGRHSLAEIAEFGNKKGYRFIAMSEHSDALTEEIVIKYVKECAKLSTSECVIIPGIEFTCENDLHILGLGLEHFTSQKDPLQIVQFIGDQKGISVIAHPSRYNYRLPSELLDLADGLEVWNVAYDGRFVPNNRALNLLRQVRNQNGNSAKPTLAFGGQDLHIITSNRAVEIRVYCPDCGRSLFLKALRDGNFTISNNLFQLNPKREMGWFRLLGISVASHIYHFAKAVRVEV